MRYTQGRGEQGADGKGENKNWDGQQDTGYRAMARSRVKGYRVMQQHDKQGNKQEQPKH